MDVMKKKQMLATLVMLSLLQGSVYAETINPGIHDKYVSVNIDGDQRTIINIPDEYNFKGGLSIDRNINASMDKYNSIIGLESSANDSDKKLEITIGSENADSDKVNIKLNSNSQKNLNNTLIQVGGNGNKFKNIIEINLKNADMFLEGNNYYAAIASRNFYNPITESTNGDIKIIGDNNSNLFISGNMHMGVYSSGSGELIIKGIDDFIISKNTAYYEDGQVKFSDDIAAISTHSDKSYIEANNLIIQGENLEDNQNAFYTGIKVGSDTVPVNSKLNLVVNNNIKIDSALFGIYNGGDANITADNIVINAKSDVIDKKWNNELEYGGGEGIVSTGVLNITAQNDIYVKGEFNGVNLDRVGLKSTAETEFNKQIGNTNITSANGTIKFIGENGAGLISNVQSYQDDIRNADFKAKGRVDIYGKEVGVAYQPGSRKLSISSELSDVNITSDDTAFSFDMEDFSTAYVRNDNVRGIVDINADNGNINILGNKNGLVLDNDYANLLKGFNFYKTGYFTTVNVNAEKNINFIGESDYGIKLSNSLSDTKLDIEVPNDMDKNTILDVESQGTINVFGGKAGIMATASNTDFGSKVNLTANGDIAVQGGDYGVIAFENSNVDIDIINADNGVVSVLSGNKGLWASGKGGTINVDGAVNINANYFADESATRSAGEDVHLAVVAGLKSAEEKQNGEGLEEQNVKGLVDINLKGDVTSSIYGDIVGARGGKVVITRESGNGALVVNGDVLAGNGGTVSLDIGKNGMLTGRIDDYMDAGKKNGNSFFAPQFSDGIEYSGKVDLILGDGSRWNVDGQSWVTVIDADDNSIIDLTGAQTDRNTSAHALTVGTLNGNANFRMNLDGFDKANSDMLYIKNSNGEYNVILDDAVTSEEIGETGLKICHY